MMSHVHDRIYQILHINIAQLRLLQLAIVLIVQR